MVATVDSTPATSGAASRADTVVTVCPKCRTAYRAREIPGMPKFSRTRGKDGLCTVWFDCSCGTGLNAIEQRGRLLSAEESSALARASGIPSVVPAQSHFATARASLPAVYSSGDRPNHAAASESFRAVREALASVPAPLSPDSLARSDIQARMERIAKNGIGGPALAKLRAGRDAAPSSAVPVAVAQDRAGELAGNMSTLSAAVSEIDRYLSDVLRRSDHDEIDLMTTITDVQTSMSDVKDELQRCEITAQSMATK